MLYAVSIGIINRNRMSKRPILSGRKKTGELAPMGGKSKAPTLFDHTSKIQQKLLRLKQQITQKKKTLSSQPTPKLPTNSMLPQASTTLTKITKPKTNMPIIKMDEELSQFLKGIGMEGYGRVFEENGIDCMEVLRQIKQKELEEVGVVKGHALKIMVTMRKMLDSRDKASRKELMSAQTAENTNKLPSKGNPRTSKQPQSSIPNTKPIPQPLQIVIQTDSGFSPEEPLPQRRYFCLYCYQVSNGQFCGQSCQQLYDKMFEKYERNLGKVQELYGGKLEIFRAGDGEGEVDEREFVNDIGFLDQLDLPQKQKESDLDMLAYQEALQLIHLTALQSKQQSAWQAIQENDKTSKQLSSEKPEQ